MNERAFTLMETVLVIGIIGILSSILVPSFQKYQAKSRMVAHNSSLEILKSAALLFHMDYPDVEDISSHEDFPDYLEKKTDLKVDSYIQKSLGCPENFIISIKNGDITIEPGSLIIQGGELRNEASD